jgi:hypothetical protein
MHLKHSFGCLLAPRLFSVHPNAKPNVKGINDLPRSLFVSGLQKQMLFMRCAFESRQTQLNLYPFPGLKVINIRGSALLALDLIIIGNFVGEKSSHVHYPIPSIFHHFPDGHFP